MGIALCGHLRQVCDGYYLNVAGYVVHQFSHTVSDIARHAGVNFIENNRRQLHLVGHNRLYRKHKTGNFSTRSCVAHRHRLLILVEGKEKFYEVDACGCKFSFLYRNFHLQILHAQRQSTFFKHGCKLCGRLTATFRNVAGYVESFLFGPFGSNFESMKRAVAGVDRPYALFHAVAQGDKLFH